MQKENRVPQLDALRGLAALSVFWGHAFGMMPQVPRILEDIQFTPFHFFYDGSAAVLLFFVLSGFVLNLKYVSFQTYPPHWVSAFIIRRIFRIYPAFLIAIILGLTLKEFVYEVSAMAPFSDWFSRFWKNPLVPAEFLRMLSLIGPNINSDQLDPPMWSLVYEMRISLFFPLIILMANGRRGIIADIVLMAVTYAICLFLSGLHHKVGLIYVPHFMLGAMCAKHFHTLRWQLAGMSRIGKAIWLAVALVFYETAAMSHKYPAVNVQVDFIINQLVGLGAAGLILASASFVKIEAFLKRSMFQFIGRTSYSFYLVHIMLLFAPGPLIYRATRSYAITWLSTLALAYGVSCLIFEFVEVPMIKQGNRISNWFSGRFL
jgi:peptidoglycan/LPS O-acetylase OafA/YrhL